MDIAKLVVLNSLAVVLLVLVGLSTEENPTPPDDDVEKIIGGHEVRKKLLYPYAAAIIQKKGYHYDCMGSVIHWSYVLTSCHCLTHFSYVSSPKILDWKDSSDARIVIAGTYYIHEIFPLLTVDRSYFGLIWHPDRAVEPRLKHFGEQTREMRDVFIHARCRSKFGFPLNDIGVMRLDHPFAQHPHRMSVSIAPVFSHVYLRAVKFMEEVEKKNGSCHSVGWGSIVHLDPDEPFPPARKVLTRYVREVEMKLVSTYSCFYRYCAEHFRERCTRQFKNRLYKEDYLIFEKQFCLYPYHTKDKGPCLGDSGGPLICRDRRVHEDEHRGFLTGVLVTTIYCGMYGGGPHLYEKLYDYYNFLNNFDMRFTGYSKNPWGNSPDCSVMKMPNCTTKKSSSVRIKMRACFLALSLGVLFLS